MPLSLLGRNGSAYGVNFQNDRLVQLDEFGLAVDHEVAAKIIHGSPVSVRLVMLRPVDILLSKFPKSPGSSVDRPIELDSVQR